MIIQQVFLFLFAKNLKKETACYHRNSLKSFFASFSIIAIYSQKPNYN
ncbi:hypothetical protein X874_18830 [Mannheimia varigena USDA-ARS-USMARC-1312]|uniref:Uncharacterized protein n=1 Tax=Mannheimia varigena USDA-ARS-USMARC-1296 TaxID=1433287 RepID=W0QGZ9_9PAST|nr:hypothetical protein X808_20100 [Mannheimia varigena USDA-ARS-USMARC-1296]AHG78516.1 hypothetical protein X874_18830 [Mannheimia varigena USDA-ARS-USMARC-1312]